MTTSLGCILCCPVSCIFLTCWPFTVFSDMQCSLERSPLTCCIQFCPPSLRAMLLGNKYYPKRCTEFQCCSQIKYLPILKQYMEMMFSTWFQNTGVVSRAILELWLTIPFLPGICHHPSCSFMCFSAKGTIKWPFNWPLAGDLNHQMHNLKDIIDLCLGLKLLSNHAKTNQPLGKSEALIYAYLDLAGCPNLKIYFLKLMCVPLNPILVFEWLSR